MTKTTRTANVIEAFHVGPAVEYSAQLWLWYWWWDVFVVWLVAAAAAAAWVSCSSLTNDATCGLLHHCLLTLWIRSHRRGFCLLASIPAQFMQLLAQTCMFRWRKAVWACLAFRPTHVSACNILYVDMLQKANPPFHLNSKASSF